MTLAPLVVALIVLVAFAPPALLAWRLRNLEIIRPEPWRGIVIAFAWGATGAVAASILVETWFLDVPLTGLRAGFIGLVLVAPIVEEILKAAGLGLVRDDDPEPEDGYIYGAIAGLGFAATENVLYVITSLTLGGITSGVTTLLYRTIATVTLHAAATAWTGHGIWQARRTGRYSRIPLYLLAAIALHAAFNWLTTYGLLLGAAAGILLAVHSYRRIERRIRSLDTRAPHLG